MASAGAAICWVERKDGIDLHVRASPNARNDGQDGLFIDASCKAYLKIRTRAIAEDGKANEAIGLIIARMLDVPKSAVSLVSGGSARYKTFRIAGDPALLVGAISGCR